MNFAYLNVNVVNKVGYITINHPPVNVLNSVIISELHECFNTIQANSEIKAVILTGEGKCFVAGADLRELLEACGDREKAEEISREGQRLFNKIETFNKPVIAAINGACLGGGLELAMSCQMRIAADGAKLGLPEIKLGIIPGYGGTQRLSRLTNKAKALELILTGDFINGTEAVGIGLVNHSVPIHDVMPKAIALAEGIAMERSSASVKAAMEAVLTGFGMTIDEGQVLESRYFGELFMTGDAKEGIQAFLEKRRAVFKDH